MKQSKSNRNLSLAGYVLRKGAILGLFGYGLGYYLVNDEMPVDRFERELRNRPIEEIEVQRWKPRVSVYDDRTEVDFRYGDRWYGGSVLIDKDNDGSVDSKVDYPLPFRGVGGVNRTTKVTEADQRRYDEVMESRK